jgi:hypothetical protein
MLVVEGCRKNRTANKTEKREKQLAMEAAMRAMSN